MKTALITGVVGQDGAYLSRLLLGHGYRVLGTTPDIPAPEGFVEAYLAGVELRVVDLTDRVAMRDLLDAERPDEIYNLASISSVLQSWSQPVQATAVNGVALLGLLEEIRALGDSGYEPRLCQASSSEMFGPPRDLPQHEDDPILPTNPYAVAKAFAHFTARNYRLAYGMHVSTVILFNHESPLRPTSFVTRKITSTVAGIAAGRQDQLELGRMDVRRDWGAAADYVRAMHLTLMHDVPGDFVVATGQSHSLLEFVDRAFAAVGITDYGHLVTTNPGLVRPTDIPETRGDPSRAESLLGWRPRIEFDDLVRRMVAADVHRLSSGVEHDPSYLAPVA